MRKDSLWLLLLLALIPETFGRCWQLEASTRKLAAEILDRDLKAVPSSGKIQVDRDHQAEAYEVRFQVPQGVPSFLVVTTRASRRGHWETVPSGTAGVTTGRTGMGCWSIQAQVGNPWPASD